MPSAAFIETWFSALDKKSLVAFNLMGTPVAETDPLHRLLFLRAGGSAQKEPARSAMPPPETDIDDYVDVEQLLGDGGITRGNGFGRSLSQFRDEVPIVSVPYISRQNSCPCAFAHVPYPRLVVLCKFLQNSRVAVAQLHIAKALFNKNMTLSVLHEPTTQTRDLQKAASLLFDWVGACLTEAAELQNRNEVPVVLILCGSGPKYVLIKKVTNATRLSQRVFVHHTFQDMLLSFMLQHQGRGERVFDSMRSVSAASGHPCADLLPT